MMGSILYSCRSSQLRLAVLLWKLRQGSRGPQAATPQYVFSWDVARLIYLQHLSPAAM